MSLIKIGTYFMAICLWIGILSVVVKSIRFFKSDAKKLYSSTALLLFVLVLGAGVFLFGKGATLNRLGIEDALEYFVAAERFSHSDSYSLSLNGQNYPSRFPPFFSTIVIAPFLDLSSLLKQSGPFFAYLPVFALSLLALISAFFIGVALTNIWGGVFAFLGCLLLPEFRYFSGYLMSDAPFAALWLLSMLYFLLQLEVSESQHSRWLVPGLLVAGAFGLRPLGIFLLIPWFLLFIVQARGRKFVEVLPDAVMLTTPVAVFVMINLVYNSKIFGSALRTGYHYWMSIPYDFRELTFSLSYVTGNVIVLVNETAVLPALFVIIAILFATRHPELATVFTCKQKRVVAAVLYIVIPALGLIIFHALYFYTSSRFFLPVSMLLITVAGGVVGGFLGKLKVTPYALIFCTAVSGLLAGASLYVSREPELDLEKALELRESVPPLATLVSAHNPLFLEYFVNRGTSRRLVPWSRDLPYASKFATASAPMTFNTEDVHWSDHRLDRLRASGAIVDPYPVVMQEAPRLFAEWLKQKHLVYIDTSLLSQEDLKWINTHFFVTRFDNGMLYLRESCLQYD